MSDSDSGDCGGGGKEMSAAQIRKSNKPLMEKKRRARINDSLVQLKSLVLDAMKKDTSRYSKLEKADILEMTVKHLRTVQRSHMAVAMTSDPTVVSKYRAGFNECAGEVNRYLGSIDGLDTEVRGRLLSHLAGCMTTITPSPPQMQMSAAPLHPIQVQIPTATSLASMPGGTTVQMVATSPTLQRLPTSSPEGAKITGAFQIVPGTLPNGEIAFFVPTAQQTMTPHTITSQTVTPVYFSPSSQGNQQTAFATFPVAALQAMAKSSASPTEAMEAPVMTSRLPEQSHYHHHHHVPSSTAVQPSPPAAPSNVDVKEERVWRPW